MEALAAYGSDSEASGSSGGGSGSQESGSSEPQAAGKRVRRSCRDGNTESSGPASFSGRTADALNSSARKSTLLPPPADVLKLFGTNAHLTGAGSGVHLGRKRAFEHTEGFFPTTVYIPVPFSAELRDVVTQLLDVARAVVPDVHPVAATAGPAGDELHLSLSRTVAVKKELIPQLVESLKRALRPTVAFWVTMTRLAVFVNDDRSRTFLALEIDRPCLAPVAAAIRGVDSAFAKQSFPAFYSPPRPHVSVAWALGDQEGAFGRIIERWGELHGPRRQPGAPGDESGAAAAEGSSAARQGLEKALRLAVDTVEAVVGKRVYAVWGVERAQPGQKAAFLPPRGRPSAAVLLPRDEDL